jgi:tripartite-type tricarboxylate transporter receptor subunit TctC
VLGGIEIRQLARLLPKSGSAMAHRGAILLATGALAAAGRTACAQDRYPARPVTVINPFAAGGQSDPIGRQCGPAPPRDPVSIAVTVTAPARAG